MNIFQRIAGAFKAQPKKGKFILWPVWREGVAQWTLTNLQSLIDDGFEANGLVYAAVMYKARAFSSVPLLAYDDNDELLPDTAPLAQLLARPHPLFTWIELEALLSVYYNLFGECYVYAFRPTRNAPPVKLYPLRPDRVRHIYRDQELIGYEYIPAGTVAGQGMPMLIEDTMHVSLPNPGDEFGGFGKGFSGLFPARKSIDVDNSATDFLKLFFDNGALPPGVLQFESPLDDTAVTQAQERWAEIYGGYQRWTEPAVLDSGGKYQKIGLTIQELDMSTLDARTESRITMVFGVPISLIETRPSITQSTQNNKEQDRKMFWEDTMTWELTAFESEWKYFLGGPWGTVRYDLSGVDALASTQKERAEMLLRAFELSVVDTDEARAGLGLPADPRGPRFLYKLGVQLLPATVVDAAPTPVLTTTTDNQDAGATQAEEDRAKRMLPAPSAKAEASPFAWKAAVATKIDQTAAAFEPDARRAVKRAFEDDRRALLAILGEHKATAYQERKSVVWQFVLMDALDWVKGAGKDNWRHLLIPVLEATVTEQTAHLNATFGMSFDVRQLLAEEWFKAYELTFVDPISATTEEQLTAMFDAALADGYSIPDMEKALNTLFEQWIESGVTDPTDKYFATRRLPPWRLETIARTETMRASNAGAFNLYKAWGTTQKEWLATGDGRTRDSHAAANGQVVDIDQPFIVGGAPMQYPGDPNAPLSEVANCRCTVIPVL